MYGKRGVLFEQGASVIFVQVQLKARVADVLVREVDRFEGDTFSIQSVDDLERTVLDIGIGITDSVKPQFETSVSEHTSWVVG
jgi:hypothetical protein